ncbi:MAG: carboxypeptidase regulatory-like domain-containing protein [Ignavibacteria bacterium]|nr:carboxypeptidase regulatory-like domain-containing protein [Ignavibacteria bacterium]MDH7528650.1 carboxypeptidase regulatory-like domain-containing protein [Ignavibacteria bacterium]
MKQNRILVLSFISILMLFYFSSCGKSPTQPETPTLESVTLNGQVIDFETGQAIENAAVKILADTTQYGTTTDADGKFSKTIQISKSLDLIVVASKENYKSDSTKVFAVPGRTIDVPTLKIERIKTTSTSGQPASIVLVNQTFPSIGVKESGDNETTTLTFEVRDSSGNPIGIDKSVTVNFTLGANPGGGIIVDPPSKKTNSEGKVSVNITSGTIAGVVQIIAEINLGTKIIRSKPVNIAIHGGLPDYNHFSIAAEYYNVPGLVKYGFTDNITAYVGDKYSNPVKPNTIVYFSTTGGIIQGSAITNELGTATATLLTALPAPIHPTLGPGFATIRASTADENNQTISREIVILFSGHPQLTISPTTIDVPNGGSQTFTYTVADLNGNPIASGNTISVTVEGNVKAQGDVSINMPDTQSRSWTQFSFTLIDADPEKFDPQPVTVKIEVDGVNGKNSISISGTSR